MNIGTFLIENALQLMYLCFGLGMLILTISLARTLGVLRRTVSKIEGIVELLDDGIRKPIQMLMEVGVFLGPIIKMFTKRK